MNFQRDPEESVSLRRVLHGDQVLLLTEFVVTTK